MDLKSFSNSSERPIESAINGAIARYKHFLAVVVYREAVAAAKAMIRSHGVSAVHWSSGDPEPETWAATLNWACRLAQVADEPTCLWVYQQTGPAPVTRGRIQPSGSVHMITESAVQTLKRRWVECNRTFGTDPWLDIAPIAQTVHEDIP